MALTADEYFQSGRKKYKLGLLEEAVGDWTEAIHLDSSHAWAYFNRGVAKSALRDYQGAILDYDHAIFLNQKCIFEAYVNRGAVKQELGDLVGALSDYNQALFIKPKESNALNNRAYVKTKLGDLEGAILDYDKAIQYNPRNASVYNNRGSLKSKMGNKVGAMHDYNHSINIEPDADYFYNRGILKSELGDNEGAILDYSHSIRLNPNNSEAYGNRGNAKLDLGDIEGAMSDYDLTVLLSPSDAKGYNNRGKLKSEVEDYQSAILDFKHAIHLDPSYASAYYNCAVVKSMLGDKIGAEIDYTHAILLDPNYTSAYHNRGSVRADFLKDKAGAISDFTHAIRVDPNHAKSYVGRGQVNLDMGDAKAAILDFEKSIKLDSNYAKAYVGRALAKSDLGDKEGAILDCNQAIKLDPNLAVSYGCRGLLKSDLGDKNGAILDYNQAILLDPSFPISYVNRGVAKFDISDLLGAILDYNQAIDLDPNLALAYLNRGAYFDKAGLIPETQLDFKRFLNLTEVRDFFKSTSIAFPHFSNHPAPYLLHRTLEKFTYSFDQFNTLQNIIDTTRQQCKPWKRWEEWRRLSGSEKHEAFTHFHALALVNHYMGDCIDAYRIYDEVLDNEDVVGMPLNLMGQYYFIESAKLFREPHEGILDFALAQIKTTRDKLIEINALRELYYAGQILWANDQAFEAHQCFVAANNYLPAAYMQVLTLPMNGCNEKEIKAKIAEIRAREAILLPENGFLRGFPARAFRLEKPDEDFLAPILHYAHYREITESIAEVRNITEDFQHHELWKAFFWRPAEEQDLDWLLRREELAHLSQALLAQFKSNVITQLGGREDTEMTIIEKAFNELIEKDDWAGTKYTDFVDFKSKTEGIPNFLQILARLISNNQRLGPHNKMLLVEYCYLRGDLTVEDAFMMYFYVGKQRGATPLGKVVAQDGLVNMGIKIIELALSPISITGQVLTAATTAAMTTLLKNFTTQKEHAPDIDIDQYRKTAKTYKPIERSDYDHFVDDFLRYLSEEREVLGAAKFAQRYPMGGFEDWIKRH